MKSLLTKDHWHNLHFEQATFYSLKWKKEEIQIRQIAYDSPNLPETWFVLNDKTMNLYIYFDDMGTKNNPRILKIGKLPENYREAIAYLGNTENAILSLISENSFAVLKTIKTEKQAKDAIKRYYSIITKERFAC